MKGKEIFELLTPPAELVSAISNRSRFMGWGIEPECLTTFGSLLEAAPRKNIHQLPGINAWVNWDMHHNLHVAFVLMYYLAEQSNLILEIDDGILKKFNQITRIRVDGGKILSNPEKRLEVIGLDIDKLYRPHCGLGKLIGEKPHCVGIWTLAANPRLVMITEDAKYNYGLVVAVNDTLCGIDTCVCFRYANGTIYVNELKSE